MDSVGGCHLTCSMYFYVNVPSCREMTQWCAEAGVCNLIAVPTQGFSCPAVRDSTRSVTTSSCEGVSLLMRCPLDLCVLRLCMWICFLMA